MLVSIEGGAGWNTRTVSAEAWTCLKEDSHTAANVLKVHLGIEAHGSVGLRTQALACLTTSGSIAVATATAAAVVAARMTVATGDT